MKKKEKIFLTTVTSIHNSSVLQPVREEKKCN